MGGRGKLPAAWEDAIGGWVKWMRVAGRSARTINTRRGHVQACARATATRHPAEVTIENLVLYYADRDYSLEHRRGARTSLIQFYQWCVTNGVTEHNPAEELPKVQQGSANPKPAPEWLWSDLLKSAPPRELLMVRLAGEVGLRREEIAKVSQDDVIWNGDGYSLIVHGKGGRQRVVPINDRLAEIIQRGRFSWIPPGVNTPHLFPSIDKWGNLVAPHLSADRVGRLISDLMPKGWSAHKLRHRYATKGFAGTKNLRAVQVALGHASVATTQRYVATSELDVRAVSEAAAS